MDQRLREAIRRLSEKYEIMQAEYIDEDHDDPDLKQEIDDGLLVIEAAERLVNFSEPDFRTTADQW